MSSNMISYTNAMHLLTDDTASTSDSKSKEIPTNTTIKQFNKNDPALKLFWNKLHEQWIKVYHLLMNGNEQGLILINSFLTVDLYKLIEIEVTYNEINRQNLTSYSKHVELYISPRLKRDNIPTMKALYEARIPINNLLVSCYRAYHPKDTLIADIDFGEFKAQYTDFGFQGSCGYSEEHKPVLNIVIVVKQPLADKILTQKTVNFKSPDGKTTSRKVWLPTSTNAVDLFLINILGEYNLLNHVGYIEVLPDNDPIITEGSVFTELDDIKKNMIIIQKQYNYRSCNYCEHNELQTIMMKCSKCKKINYCSKKCQITDWSNHKNICI
jgi:hypothetical protein